MAATSYFLYGADEILFLKSKDTQLAQAIDLIGPIKREVTPDLFASLVNSIVGQQISTKAQTTIWQRMLEQFGEITPPKIEKLTQEEIQACGISMRKAGYIKEIGRRVLSNEFCLESLSVCSDEEVRRRLSKLPGIGVWTAEMTMLFSMQRPNILSFGDLAIHRGLRMLYHHRKIEPELFEKYRRRFSPYCSVASLYLWEIASGNYGYRDYAPGKKRSAKNGR